MKKYKPTTKEELKALCDDESVDLALIDTSIIIDMSGLFKDSKRTDFSGINTWDTSNVYDMSYMFSGCLGFNQKLNINSSKLVNANEMFSGCKNLELKNIPNFNYIDIERQKDIFKDCDKILSILYGSDYKDK